MEKQETTDLKGTLNVDAPRSDRANSEVAPEHEKEHVNGAWAWLLVESPDVRSIQPEQDKVAHHIITW